MTTAYMSM